MAIEVIRQRAKHRLIGTSVLVLAGVVVFPLLFDTQPRPIPVDIVVDIPSRHAAKPLVPAEPAATVTKPQPVATAEAESARPTDSRPVVSAAKAPAKEQAEEEILVTKPATDGKDKDKDQEKDKAWVKAAPPVTEKAPQASVAPATKAADAQVTAKAKEADRAQALLEGKPVPSTPTASPAAPPPTAAPSATPERFIVQLGAFAEQARAQEVRLKLERAGLKTYTHVAETPEGKRIRVRLGPFSSKAEAEKAAAKAKAVGVQSAILTL